MEARHIKIRISSGETLIDTFDTENDVVHMGVLISHSSKVHVTWISTHYDGMVVNLSDKPSKIILRVTGDLYVDWPDEMLNTDDKIIWSNQS